MKHLIKFSLKRRFNNKAIIVLNILMLIIVGLLMFADKVILYLQPGLFNPLTVYVDSSLYQDKEMFKIDETEVRIRTLNDSFKDEDIQINKETDNVWHVRSKYPLTSKETTVIYGMIQNYNHYLLLNGLNYKDVGLINDTLNFEMVNDVSADSKIDVTKQNIIFMIITSIYFMMLSYSSVIANEVVYEKTSKILELILTSVSAKTHFISKMLIGWLTIMIQTMITGLIIVFWFWIRSLYDSGFNLLMFLYNLKIIPVELMNFKELFSFLNIDLNVIGLFMVALLFLVLGILLLQMIMVIISSFVSSIEESSNVQAPCYLILLVVYYFALWANDPYQMSEGVGRIMSFVPFFSMLFMPCRLLIQSVTAYEIMIALLCAILAIFFIMDFGLIFYKQGILDNHKMSKRIKKKIAI
ncbi:MAG: ABC transporter permease [Erysipelotrichaceae bacterium]|nr:ABC transporter permease [Erysipelotrichaceae bacterium]MDD3923571.1 ABC transporter permease [Erysipelotrichaceae bacterium]MDD4643144.1 ABC transporter permease [Erysipelotrichaceae bacterium]